MRLKPAPPREDHPEDVQRVMAKKSAENFEIFINFEIPEHFENRNFWFSVFFLKFWNFVIQSPKAGPAPRVNLVVVYSLAEEQESHHGNGFEIFSWKDDTVIGDGAIQDDA